jgi:hypothetical protein
VELAPRDRARSNYLKTTNAVKKFTLAATTIMTNKMRFAASGFLALSLMASSVTASPLVKIASKSVLLF